MDEASGGECEWVSWKTEWDCMKRRIAPKRKEKKRKRKRRRGWGLFVLAIETVLGEGGSNLFVLAESYLCNGHSVDEGEGVVAASEEAGDETWTR